MSSPKIFIRKVLVGIVLIALAACATLFIKESLDTQDPESALPLIRVEYNGTPLTDVYRSGYEWSFFTTVERRMPELSEADLPLVPVEVMPQVPMKITFSKEPSVLKVQRAQGRYSTDFLELTGEDPSSFLTPSSPGTYVYKVYAEWRARGYIQYYFVLQVRDVY